MKSDLENLKSLLEMIRVGSYSLIQIGERDPEFKSLQRAMAHLAVTYQ